MIMVRNIPSCSIRFGLSLLAILVLSPQPSFAATRILVDQVGYEPFASKVALVVTAREDPAPTKFALINSDTGKLALEGDVKSFGEVHAWTGMVFFRADFSSWREQGHYILRISTSTAEIASSIFAIQPDVLERNTLSN